MRKLLKAGIVSAAGLMAACGSATAAENVSGDIGYNINSHFISYGVDVWGAGGDFFGGKSTSSLYGDLAVKLTPDLSWTVNVWTDINNNVPSAIGGSLQEIDINTGFSYALGHGFTTSLTYGAWTYAGDVEEVIDFGLGFDDTGLIFSDFAFNPHLTWHYRTSGNGLQTVGSAVVLSVAPSFPLGSGFALTVPAGVAFFTTDTFQGGVGAAGYGYAYLGGSLSVPLSFVPSSYGNWSANFDVTGYFTDKNAIPGNPQANFATGSFNIKMSF